MTTIHQVNLSDDAFHLLVYIFGMWQGTEMSFDSSPRQVLEEKQGYAVYADFAARIDSRFGEGLTPRFGAAFEELINQLKPREVANG